MVYRQNFYKLCWWLSWWLVVGAAGAVGSTLGSVLETIIPNINTLKDGATYDYIVVGAGAAGAAAAARLAIAGHHVLLVEAGGDPDLISKIPGAAMGLMGTPLDWQYDTLPNNQSCLSYRDQQCRFSRGRCLGGSTSINYMMYTRGSPRDFDDLGISDWAWEDLRPYFLRYEGMQDLDRLPKSSIPYHNTTGTMRVGFFADSKNPWHSRLVEAYKSFDIPYNPDVNAESQIGVSQVLGYVAENKRMSTARGYLDRTDVKSRLEVAKLTRCTSVILDDYNEAKGITVAHGILQRQLRLYATKEVVLSAGTIGTPQILMLSGIGPAKHLQKFNIPVRLNLPVGDGMTDHAFPLVFIKCDRVGSQLVDSLASIGLTDVSTFINTHCFDFNKLKMVNNHSDCELPNVQIIHAYIQKYVTTVGGPLFQKGTDLNDEIVMQLKEVNDKYAFITLSPALLQPYSTGTVRLASTDPLAPPAIYPNFLSDKRDLEEMVRAMKILEELVNTKVFKLRGASIVRLKLAGCPDASGDEYWACYSRHMTHTTYHSVGTTALGRVVDERLRVRGARRLRVADLGVMPRLVRANTAATAIAIGERLADFLLAEK